MKRASSAGKVARVTAITERIVARMREQGLEEIDLAAAVRVAQSTVNRWTHHYSDPRASSVPALAECLDVSIAWLLTGAESVFDDRTVLSFYEGALGAEDELARLLKRRKEPTREELQEVLKSLANARQMLQPPVTFDGPAEDPAPRRGDLGDLSKKLAERASDQEARRQQRGRRRPPPA